MVDIPGFDDTDVPDGVILKKIGDWMKKKFVIGSYLTSVD
jgi:hypothetical protein